MITRSLPGAVFPSMRIRHPGCKKTPGIEIIWLFDLASFCQNAFAPPNRVPPSEQAELLPSPARRTEMLGGEFDPVAVEAEPRAGGLEAPADHPRVGPGAGHALAPLGVVVLAAAHLADQREHVFLAVGEIRREPFAKEVAHLERQAQQHVAGAAHPGRRRGVEDALDL